MLRITGLIFKVKILFLKLKVIFFSADNLFSFVQFTVYKTPVNALHALSNYSFENKQPMRKFAEFKSGTAGVLFRNRCGEKSKSFNKVSTNLGVGLLTN